MFIIALFFITSIFCFIKILAIKSLIESSYKPYYCSYFVVDYFEATDVAKIILQLNLPFVTQHAFLNDSIVCEDLHVRLITANNATHLRNIFPEAEYFPSFSTVVLLVNYDLDIMKAYFKMIVEMYGAEVFIAEVMNIQVQFLNFSVNNGVLVKNIRNFQDAQLKRKLFVSAFNCFPNFMRYSENEYGGVEYLIVTEMAKNFELDYHFHDVNVVRDPWDETTKDIISQYSDIGVCSQWLILYKLYKQTFTDPYAQVCITLLAPKPRPVSYTLFVLLPFNPKVWVIIIIVTVIIILILKIFAIVYKVIGSRNRYESLVNCAEHILEVLMQQSVNNFVTQKRNALRILFLIWCLSSLLIATGYSAGIVSLFTKPRFTKPINTMVDFVRANIHWGGASDQKLDILISSNDTVLIQIEKLHKVEQNYSVKNARIHGGNYGSSVSWIPNKYLFEIDFLDKESTQSLRPITECMERIYLIFILRKNFPFKDEFNRKLERIVESGLVDYWYTIIGIKSDMSNMHMLMSNSKTETEEYKPLTLNNTIGIFVFLFMSLFLAIIVFFIEFYYKKLKAKL